MKKQIFKAYWPSFRKYWMMWALTLISLIISVSLQAVAPYYTRGIVDTFTSPIPDVPMAMKFFFDMILVIAGIIIAYRVFDFGIAMHESHTMKDIDSNSFRAIQRQSMSFFEDTPVGSLIMRLRRFSSSYEQLTDLFFFQFGRNAVMLITISIAFSMAVPSLALPFMGWTFLFILYSIVTTYFKYPLDKKRAAMDSKVGSALADSLSNHLAVKTFGQEDAEQRRFDEVVHQNHQARLRSWLWGDVIMAGQALIMACGELSLIWWMLICWEQGTITAGDFIFVQTFVVSVVSHLWPFGRNLRQVFNSLADAEEMAETHHRTPEVRDAAGARSLFIEDGEIEFHAVNFRYGGETSSTKDAVSNVSLTIPAGQSVGLVGKSGSGKSTLVKLLLRFYDLDSGYLRIDRQDIANVTQKSLRQQIAVVPQQPQLFHRSIRENIAFARSDATEAEIISAAQQAFAWEFIEELPNGLDTLVGERGIKLSGGQQQRIAIARAILADPRILILDEATSALDSETEKLIQKAIANLLKRRTAIVIAHRLSTINQLDCIIVMDNGVIVEKGTHCDLLNLNGSYANLWSHQSGGYIN